LRIAGLFVSQVSDTLSAKIVDTMFNIISLIIFIVVIVIVDYINSQSHIYPNFKLGHYYLCHIYYFRLQFEMSDESFTDCIKKVVANDPVLQQDRIDLFVCYGDFQKAKI